MAYDYSSENKRLELPNPYRIENLFLFACATILLLAGLLALAWARAAIESHAVRLGIAPLLVGIALVGAGLGFAVAAARRLRFFFGRGRPASLAPEVAIGAVGNSKAADGVKAMLRQGGLEYREPTGALNGVLYHAMPRLITAPQVVQSMTQRHFFNALAFLVTLASFVVAWGLFGTPQTRPAIGIAYFLFGAVMLLRPLVADREARLHRASLVALIVAAVVGPVLVGLLGDALPSVRFALDGQALFLLVSASVAVVLILLALHAQVDPSPPTERSCEQATLSMNGPPGALLTELDRRLQDAWTERIPNRRYARTEPVAEGAAGSGRFAGELLEESQPMPLGGTAPLTFENALTSARHGGLVVLDLYATLLVVMGVTCALVYVRGFDPAHFWHDGWGGSALVGYAAVALAVAAFCFRSAGAIWGRFNFESVLLWVELQGTWQSSRIGTGSALSSRLQTENDVVRVESMTLRVWRARVESVVFGKDGARQVTAMFATSAEAAQLAADLREFASTQSVFVAPRAKEDQRRIDALQATEAMLDGGRQPVDAALGDATPDRPRVAGARFCAACGAKAAPEAKFCSACGQPLPPR